MTGAKLLHAASDVHLMRLPGVGDTDPNTSGRIVVVELARSLPFEVRRVYWIHGMAEGERRGLHAHRRLWQAMIAMSGGAEVEFDDGTARKSFVLSSCEQCLIVPPGLWRHIISLEMGSTLMVLASESYDETDYIRDYGQFTAYRKGAHES